MPFQQPLPTLLQGSRKILADRSGSVLLEFAVVANVLFVLLFALFEVSYDLFTQSALDGGLQVAVRALQTGNAQNAKNGTDFINNYLCPPLAGILGCSNLYVSVSKLSPTSSQDLYNFTTGAVPQASPGVLDLSAYASANFCNSGPSQLVLVSAIYVGPSILGTFIPGFALSYSGRRVHATLSTTSIVTESYTVQTAGGTVAPSC